MEDEKLLFGTVNTVIADSGLCLFRGLIYMFDRGIYDIVWVKKRRFWSTGIYEYGIHSHFDQKKVIMATSQKILWVQTLV